jgi:hypothetical protein
MQRNDGKTIRAMIQHRTLRLILLAAFVAWIIGTALNAIYPAPGIIRLESGQSLDLPPPEQYFNQQLPDFLDI